MARRARVMLGGLVYHALNADFRWLAPTHAMRWHVAHHTVGRGHSYQSRFQSFPIQEDDHLHTACRYVERNALSDEYRGVGLLHSMLQGRRIAQSRRDAKCFLSDLPLRLGGFARVPDRRLSHADRRRVICCKMLEVDFEGGHSRSRPGTEDVTTRECTQMASSRHWIRKAEPFRSREFDLTSTTTAWTLRRLVK